LKLERLLSDIHPLYKRALSLYDMSFPHHEKRQPHSQAEILNDDLYHFDLIFDDDTFIGIILNWEYEKFIYVEHFCILPEMRNKRYGQKALSLLSQRGKTVILEIDPPIDEIAMRRKGFYERCGFVSNPFRHIHPPYHKDIEGHKLMIMTSPSAITEETYDLFNKHLNEHIMKNAFMR